jgi:hypothetical protein
MDCKVVNGGAHEDAARVGITRLLINRPNQ